MATIGKVTFTVDFNGEKAVAEAEVVGRQIGAALNRGVSRNSSKAEGDLGKIDNRLKGINQDSSVFFSRWKELPHGFRQVVFYIGLFAALGQSIAVLGSATGGALTIALPILGAFGAGLGVVLAGFIGITGAASSFPASIQPAVVALQAFITQFKALGTVIKTNLFAGLEGPFSDLTNKVLPVLSTGLAGIATVLNGSIRTAIAGLTSGEGLATITALFQGFLPILASTSQAALTFGAALAKIAVIALPFAQAFGTFLQNIATQFLNFVNSASGILQIQGFLENTQLVFKAIVPLIGAAGKLLSGLVTTQTVDSLTILLGNVTQFLPILGQLIGALGQADIFGVFAVALKTIGDAISPILPDLATFGAALGGAVKDAIVALGPALSQIAQLIVGPLAKGLVELLPSLPQLVTSFVQLAVAIAPLIPPLVQLVVAVLPVISFLIDNLTKSLTGVGPVLSTFVSGFTLVIQVISDLLTGNLQQAVTDTQNFWNGVWNSLSAPVQAALQQVLSIVQGTVANIDQFIIDFVTNTTGMVRDFFTNTVGMFTDFGVNVATTWNAFWTGLGAVVNGVFLGIVSLVRGQVNTVIDLINGMIGAINGAIGGIKDATGGVINFGKIPKIPHLASGGITNGISIAGESGPEAVIPLSRPLSQVDPSVRDLSALLQGGGSASTTNSGRSVTVAPGAIVVSGVRNESQAASSMLDRLVAFAA